MSVKNRRESRSMRIGKERGRIEVEEIEMAMKNRR
jgi:hypothetical protein